MTVTIPRNSLHLRTGTAADAQACSKICYEAFTQISELHGFPPDFPHPEMTEPMMGMLFAYPKIYSVVVEADGQILGSNFLWEESVIAGVGPITVAPHLQNANLGKRLMTAVLGRAQQQGFDGVRLVQAAYNNRSLSLYTKLGFDVQEPLAHLQGTPLAMAIPGYAVRPAIEADLAECNRLCQQVHGFDRGVELHQAIQRGTATVVDRDGRITGYATLIGFFGHAVGETNEDLKALIAAATTIEGSGLLLPTRNSDLFRWCLERGLRVVQPMNLMSRGFYTQPQGAFLPSIIF